MQSSFCKKIGKLVSFCLTLLLLLAGCAAKSSSEAQSSESMSGSYDDSVSYAGDGFKSENAAAAETGGARQLDAPASAVTQTRKLVKRAEVSVEADKSLVDGEGRLSGVNLHVEALLKKYNAYSEQTRSDENYARYTIRVPQLFYESLLAETGTLGKVRSRSETAEDVTLKYYDMEGRLNTKKTLLATFQGYLSRTQNIDDIMKVETRIAELQNEIDWLGTQLTQLSSLVDYAAIELNIYSTSYSSNYTLGDRIGNLFGSFGGFASGMLVVVLGIVIFGIPIIFFCFFFFWLLFGKVGLLKKAARLVMGRKKD
ncbi:hypothetical protein AGMMS50230_12900 [Spirochaetia bacterium]|nr:hypothetical protein AGMMS50230_12900 [Spirochaetia bacterium]